MVEGSIGSSQLAFIWSLAALLVIAGILPAQTESGVRVLLKGEATVDSQEIFLEDIADILGPDEELRSRLARTSMGSLSGAKILTQQDVRSSLRHPSFDPGRISFGGAPFTRVCMETRTVDPEELVHLLKAHFASITQWEESEIEISMLGDLHEVAIPVGETRLRVAGRESPPGSSKVILPIEVLIGGDVCQTFWVRARVSAKARVVRMTRRVPYRAILTPDDLEEAVCDVTDFRAVYFRSVEEASGLVAKRSLSQPDLLIRGWVTGRDLVRRGDTVRLVFEGEGVTVTAEVQALQSGKLGEIIKVKRTESNKSIMARVTGQGEVRVHH